MPLYELQCMKCDAVVETYYSSYESYKEDTEATIDHSQFGASCGGYMIKIWSLPANINIAKPSIVFRNPKTGETQIATHDNDQAPFGYVKEELRNPIERSKFEKEQSMRQSVEDAITSERVYTEREEIHKDRQANIRANMGQYDGATQSMLKAAMKRTRKRKFVPKKTEVKFTVNHTDSSNMIK